MAQADTAQSDMLQVLGGTDQGDIVQGAFAPVGVGMSQVPLHGDNLQVGGFQPGVFHDVLFHVRVYCPKNKQTHFKYLLTYQLWDTLNNASDYQSTKLYRTPNPNPSPIVR